MKYRNRQNDSIAQQSGQSPYNSHHSWHLWGPYSSAYFLPYKGDMPTSHKYMRISRCQAFLKLLTCIPFKWRNLKAIISKMEKLEWRTPCSWP
jgi:hypothetical protein